MKNVPTTSTTVSVPELPKLPRSYVHSLGRVVFRIFFGNWSGWFKDLREEEDLGVALFATLLALLISGGLWLGAYVAYSVWGAAASTLLALISVWISYYTSAMVLGMLSRPVTALHETIQKDRYLP